jgi:hypothetical protein
MLLLQGIGGTVAATTIPEGGVGGVVLDNEIKEYGSVEEAEQAGLPKGTRITVGGKLGTIQ